MVVLVGEVLVLDHIELAWDVWEVLAEHMVECILMAWEVWEEHKVALVVSKYTLVRDEVYKLEHDSMGLGLEHDSMGLEHDSMGLDEAHDNVQLHLLYRVFHPHGLRDELHLRDNLHPRLCHALRLRIQGK